MKQKVKQFLNYVGLYEYFKYSWIFYQYERIAKPQVQRAKEKELYFYQSFLSPCNLIFDIGANDGHKTEAFLKIAKQVVSCEPDAKNFKTLQVRFRHQRQRVMLKQIALGATKSEQTMYVHHPGSAFNTLNSKFKQITEFDNLDRWNEKLKFTETIKVPVTTLDLLIQKYGQPYFIKIDVEGFELEVLKGLNDAVPYISIECLFPEFEAEFYEMQSLLLKRFGNVSYNIAIDEKLILPSFLSSEEINSFLKHAKPSMFEAIIQLHANP